MGDRRGSIQMLNSHVRQLVNGRFRLRGEEDESKSLEAYCSDWNDVRSKRLMKAAQYIHIILPVVMTIVYVCKCCLGYGTVSGTAFNDSISDVSLPAARERWTHGH